MGYDPVAKALHWTIVTLIVMQFPLGWIMPNTALGQRPESLDRLHLTLGLTILAVMVVRLVWRLIRPPPPLPQGIARWQATGSRFVHGAFYALLIATPIMGWAWASAKGWPIVIYGALPLPPLLAAHSPLLPMAAAAHQYLGWALLALIGLHVLAVFYHAVVRRDDVALRMLPR